MFNQLTFGISSKNGKIGGAIFPFCFSNTQVRALISQPHFMCFTREEISLWRPCTIGRACGFPK
ncbi:hypothetical protein D3I44_06645 [Enterococcus faecium]|nr:hypothetical protein [Enterococcus faecium]